MKTPVFTGTATAIVTPFEDDGRTVDYKSFANLVEFQIEQGINAIVVAGTSGEGSTLSDAEHRELLKFAVQQVAGRVPVIAGTGSNDTAYAVDLSIYACAVGCDALLLVTPYYNKATQEGLYQSFTEIANAVSKPCILYNVPSRTGCNLLPATVARLAEHPNIYGIKEASGNISQIAEVARLCKDKIAVYSGNDDQIVPIMSLGGIGVISVLSNVLPKETVEMTDAMLSGDYVKARDLQLRYLPLVDSLFCEVNPIPVKAAVAAMGYCKNIVRLPLTSMTKPNEDKMLEIMREHGIHC